MKSTIYIESISRQDKDDPSCYHYVPVSHNGKLILTCLLTHNITCEKVNQTSEEYWELQVKGRKKNVRAFITELMLITSDIYTIREYFC